MAFDRITAAQSKAERFARVRLARTPRVGPVNFAQLMARFGSAERALAELPSILRRTGGALTPPTSDKVEAELTRGDAAGARLWVAGDADYPALLRQIDAAPPILWTLGSLVPSARAIAIVGARNASAAGQKIAQSLALELGQSGLHIVSGLARGIDAQAHALSLPTGTIAVLGGGVDDIYPPDNAALYERIKSDGLIVSESPPGHRAQAQDFPRRNRLISGLSLGTIVVEAELRSGSLITARLAAEQNREVFAVPGSPLDPRCRGSNDLLRQGAALCETAEDVLRVIDAHFNSISGGLFAPEPEPWQGALPADNAQTEAAIAVAGKTLKGLIGATPVHRDEVLRLSGAAPSVALAALTELEIAGVIDHSGGYYSRSL